MRSKKSFPNFRLAWITGASSGLGKELALLLAQKKIPLFLTARNEGALQTLQQDIQQQTSFQEISFFPADLTQPSDLQHLLQRMRTNPPDLIINNAGLGLYGEILATSLEKQLEIIKVNIEALVQISIESARLLQQNKQSGIIVNISSAAAYFPYPLFSLYAASKRFVRDFSLSFDAEVRPFGIRILTSLPGRFDSLFRQKAAQVSHPLPFSSFDTFSTRSLAKKIITQIKKQIPSQTFDFRYKILCSLARLLPSSWLFPLLKRGIQKNLSPERREAK